MSLPGITRELLVRYLETWVPTALHAGRRVTLALATGDPSTAEAVIGVCAEYGDRLRGKSLTLVAVGPPTIGPALAAAQRETAGLAGFTVHTLNGDAAVLPVALKAASASGMPLLVYMDTLVYGETQALPSYSVANGGKPAELIVVTPPGGWLDHREAMRATGYTLTAGVELVHDSGEARLLGFGTGSAKRLEAFKDALWSVDEYAGVRYRDPHDPEGHLLDVSLQPHPGPLRRELLAHLAERGPLTVTELRHATLTDTVYRASDTVRVLGSLVTAGAVTRAPAGGRLSGDVVIALPG